MHAWAKSMNVIPIAAIDCKFEINVCSDSYFANFLYILAWRKCAFMSEPIRSCKTWTLLLQLNETDDKENYVFFFSVDVAYLPCLMPFYRRYWTHWNPVTILFGSKIGYKIDCPSGTHAVSVTKFHMKHIIRIVNEWCVAHDRLIDQPCLSDKQTKQ